MTDATPKIVAVLDACALYPPSLRDLLMWLATVRAYEPRWTEDIHSEWTYNVLADYPDVTPAQLDGADRDLGGDVCQYGGGMPGAVSIKTGWRGI